MCEDFKKTYTTVTTALGDLSKTIIPTLMPERLQSKFQASQCYGVKSVFIKREGKLQ